MLYAGDKVFCKIGCDCNCGLKNGLTYTIKRIVYEDKKNHLSDITLEEKTIIEDRQYKIADDGRQILGCSYLIVPLKTSQQLQFDF